MSNPANLRFLESKILGKPNSLEQILDVVQDAEFRVEIIEVGSLVTERFAFWRHYDKQVLRELHIAYEKRDLSFMAIDNLSHIILAFQVDWSLSDTGKPEHAWIRAYTDETIMFTRKELDPEHHSRRFLHLGEQLYTVVQPVFGWIERCPLSGYTASEDVEKLEVPHLYWANFFGPEYVRKVGREYLLNAPGWKKEGLENGGFLYVLSPSLSGTGPRAVVEEVKRYFGVESVRRRQKS